MGCTPSIHVSQTGVIYCQDSDESPSSYTGSNQQFSGVPGRFKSDLASETQSANTQSETTSEAVLLSGSPLSPASKQKQQKMTSANPKWVPPQVENNEIQLGSFRTTYKSLKLLLMFPKEDSQSDNFWWASEKLQYKTDMVTSIEDGISCYQGKFHDIVVIDNRHPKTFHAEAACKSLRAIQGSSHSVIVAVIKKSQVDKEDATILPLLNAGFDRCFIESSNLGMCINELVQLEVNDVRNRLKLDIAQVALTALNNCHDVIEITDGKSNLQFMNEVGEKVLGFTSDEVGGKQIQEIHKVDSMKSEMLDNICLQLQQGKEWEGSYLSRRKSGDAISMPCRIIPVVSARNEITHHIYIKECVSRYSRALSDLTNDVIPYHRSSIRSIRKGSYDIKHTNNEMAAMMSRRQSMAKLHTTMTIEAPIMKVINLITAAQENCPYYIAQALDKVIDILRSTELYSPQLFNQQNRSNDPVTVDLLGGLLSQGPKMPLAVRRQSEASFFKGSALQPSLSLNSLSSVPANIKKLLENEAKWDFDVIELEKITNKHPLLWLGLSIFNRFGVTSTLNCNEATVHNWLTLIEANYHSQNPYHNSTHAADVLQCTAYFLAQDRLKELFDPLDEVACLIAAIVHDVDHPGKNSAFLCNSNNELAVLYNDLSVLESHHAALAFKLTMSDDRVNIFKDLSKDDYRTLRQSILDMVLATEMTKHFEHLAKFMNLFPKSSMNEDSASGEGTCLESPDMSMVATPENIILVKRMLIKCADVSNPTRRLDMCIEWAYRIAEEYFCQTEEEKNRSLPIVMPVFDRTTCSIPKSQISFMDYFVNSMFDAWDAFADLPEVIDNLHKNYQHWKEQEQAQQPLATHEEASDPGDDDPGEQEEEEVPPVEASS